ncbi:PREDICTED: uncharacterized protein LOC109220541 [Nicotiana attenuata]|uniref:uncharacterized protein LOC109220541 n=1 Tax=Nicotiana attenuata TaxID=49451 RepID=UPI00090596DB|nr:PREDICTED: uncharacterized protein LOC109220541 [Nicotiana attenuata]
MFSPVVKPTTIRNTLAASHNWVLCQSDMQNAFLHGELQEQIFMSQPSGFIHPQYPNHVCKLKKSLYNLKHAPHAWYMRLLKFLLTAGFTTSKSDTSLFIYRAHGVVPYILLYVDDIIVTGNNSSFLESMISKLGAEFSIPDLSPLSFFLGIQASHGSSGITLSQEQYITSLLKNANMHCYKPLSTPMVVNSKLHVGDSPLFHDATLYRKEPYNMSLSLVLTLPLSSTKLACQFMHNPTAFTDTDWAGSLDDHKSAGGYASFLGNTLVSWSSKKQRTVARSSTKSEYKTLADVVAELTWIRSILSELGVHLPKAPILL